MNQPKENYGFLAAKKRKSIEQTLSCEVKKKQVFNIVHTNLSIVY